MIFGHVELPPELDDFETTDRTEVIVGGHSFVYKYLELKNGSLWNGNNSPGDFVVKLCRLFLTKDDTLQDIFTAERRVMFYLESPYVARVFFARETERLPFIVIKDYGNDLLEYDQSFSEGFCVFLRALEGLGFIHSLDVLHRDFKPENIFGEGVLGDFGVSHSVFGRVSGGVTPEYGPPEKIPSGPTYDIYQAGVLLGQLLTGSLDFVSKYLVSKKFEFSTDGILKRLYYDDENKLSLDCGSSSSYMIDNIMGPNRPDGFELGTRFKSLDEIVHKATRTDPNERYQSVSEMLEELKTVQREIELSYL